MKKLTSAIAAIGLIAVACSDPQSQLQVEFPSRTAVASELAPSLDWGSAALETSFSESAIAQSAVVDPAENLPAATLTELEIGYDTPSLDNVVLSRGAVEVVVSYTAREDVTSENSPLLRYEISYEGEQFVADSTLASGFGRVLIGDFDGDFEDVDGDGRFELVTKDKSFLAAFSSHADSILPPQLFRLEGDEFVEATRDYPDFVRAEIAKLEESFEGDSVVWHSLLAAYVADKALVGEYESARAFMRSHYSGVPETGSAMAIRNESGERIGTYDDFPSALDALLAREGYL